MIKKTIPYTDYFGEKRTDDFYFNLNEAELIEWEMSKDGGMERFVERVSKANSIPELFPIFKDFILRAYGVKSDDGRQFIKNDEVRKSFEQCPAYSILVLELIQNTEEAIKFLNGIVPKDIADRAAVEQAKRLKEIADKND
jgi:hypothetical protein